MKQVQLVPFQDLIEHLKIRNDLAVLIDTGREFQIKLPRKTRELIPYVFVLVCGSKRFAPDLSSYLQGLGTNIFFIKAGFKL